jgi:hypothetical protein
MMSSAIADRTGTSDGLFPGDAVMIKAGPLGRRTDAIEPDATDPGRVRILLPTITYQAHIVLKNDLL